MSYILSVNIGKAKKVDYADFDDTGIDKQPIAGPVQVCDPGLAGVGKSGLQGDHISDHRHHGGLDKAVYAYASEDLAEWSQRLGRPLTAGMFGENLTTVGIDVTHAVIGQQWQIGKQLLLEVSVPREPCRTFAAWLAEKKWVKTFTAAAQPGAYLRVLRPGPVQAGDPVTITYTPDHDITIELVFRALTTERSLLPRLIVAEALPEKKLQKAQKAAAALQQAA